MKKQILLAVCALGFVCACQPQTNAPKNTQDEQPATPDTDADSAPAPSSCCAMEQVVALPQENEVAAVEMEPVEAPQEAQATLVEEVKIEIAE